VPQGGGLECFQDALGAVGLEERTLALIARRARRNLLEPAQIDDFAAGRYQPTVRRKEVPGQNRAGQGEVHHALEGPGRGSGPERRKRNRPSRVRDKGTQVDGGPTFPPSRLESSRHRTKRRPVPCRPEVRKRRPWPLVQGSRGSPPGAREARCAGRG